MYLWHKRTTSNQWKIISFPNSIAFAGAGMGFLIVPTLHKLDWEYFGIKGIYVLNIILFAALLPLIHLFYPKTGLATRLIHLFAFCRKKIIDLPGGLFTPQWGGYCSLLFLSGPLLILVWDPQRAFSTYTAPVKGPQPRMSDFCESKCTKSRDRE